MPTLRTHVKTAWDYLTGPAEGEGKVGGAVEKAWSERDPFELKASAAMQAALSVRAGIEQYPPRKYSDLLAAYRRNPIVRRCTLLCAEAVAKITPVVKVNGKENKRVSEAIGQMFARPNAGQSRFAFIRDLTAYYKNSGDGWIEHVAGMAGYHEFYALRPERMNIIPGRNGWAQQYVYDPRTGQKRYWNADLESDGSDLLHIKSFAPDHDLYGAGAIEAAEAPLDLYENAQTYARAMFKNGMTPSGALIWRPVVPAGAPAPVMTKEQRDELEETIDKKYKGARKAGRPLVLGGGLEWQQFAANLVDMQAEEIRNNAARDIARAYGVPSILLGIPGDMTFNNFTEASRAFYRNTVMNDFEAIFGEIAPWVGRVLGQAGVTIEYDEDDLWALSEELSQRAQRIEGSQVLSVQEKREGLGYDREPPAGDLMLMPAGLATLDSILASDLGMPAPSAPKQIAPPK